MSLERIYTRFLASPSTDVLDPAMTLHYITTASSVHGPEEVVKHFNRENGKQLKKRVEKVIASVETSNSLVLEVEAEIEFLTSGALWLPGLDDNFIADHVLRFPVVHIVNFEKGLIKQARLYWDQSNLLKQLGVIGRNGRNWPIKDGAEQIKMIAESVSHQSSASSVSRNENGSTPMTPERSRSKGPENAMRDPHASLHLFSPASEQPEPEKVRAPRSSSAFRPPSRDLESIIGEDGEPMRAVQPPKSRGSFSRRQTFDLGEHMKEEENQTPRAAAQKTKLVDPSKYSHFEFADGPDGTEAPAPKTKPAKSTHKSSWDFEDFVTPEKKPLRMRRDDIRSFDFSEEDEKKPLSDVANGRLRNDGHFEISDNSPANYKKVGRAAKQPAPAQTTRQPQDDDADDFFGGFGKETTAAGIHIAGNGQGQSKAVQRDWSWDQNSPSVGTSLSGRTGVRPQNGKEWEY